LHDFVEAGNAAAGEDDLPASLPKAKRCRWADPATATCKPGCILGLYIIHTIFPPIILTSLNWHCIA
jgi:hypothetical protein